MANKTKATPQKEEALQKGPEIPDALLPLLDLSDAAVTKMIKQATKRGYVTYEQLNAVMPSEEVTSEQIEDVLAMLNEMGINVVETEEAEADERRSARGARERGNRSRANSSRSRRRRRPKSEAKEPTERTDDPVRMYLREMGSVGLLSREGEIAIAKRIEAGREAMIAGLCESPLTFQAIIIWRDELNDGKVFLRDIIDLEATYAGPDAKAVPAPCRARWPADRAERAAVLPSVPPQPVAPPSAPPRRHAVQARAAERRRRRTAAGAKARSAKATSTRTISRTRCRSPRSRPSSSPRCSRPSTTSPTPTSGCAACRTRTSRTSCSNESLSPAQERKYKKLKEEIIAEVKSLRLNQARIDALVEQLYDINKRLVGYEGRLMRLAESHGVAREDFLRNYQGSELDPHWLNRVSKLSAKGWKNFVASDKDRIKEHPPARSTRWRPRPGSRSASSARSCRWCRRASARRARPRRRWWRRTCAS